jgi:hypothetical protein
LRAVGFTALRFPFLPNVSATRPRYEVRGAGAISRGAIHHLELALPDGSTDHVAWSSGLALLVDDARLYVTGAPFVWQRVGRNGKPSRIFRLGGSYLGAEGRNI